MSDTKKKTSLDEWDVSAAPTMVRASELQPQVRRGRTPPTPPGEQMIADVFAAARGARGSAKANDTIGAAGVTPYVFQTSAATQLAGLLDGSATVVDPHAAEKHMAEAQRLAAAQPITQPAAEAAAPTPRAILGVDVMKLNKLVVSSYKLMGFAILGTILLGLASFIATNLFYIFNESWATPMQLSSTDPRVLQLSSQYASEKAARDGVAAQRLDFASRLSDAQRIVVSEGKFQEAFDEAMKENLADRSGQLAEFRRLIASLQRTRREVTAANHAYTAVSKEQLKQEYAARLIDKDDQTKGGYELAEIQGANLALHEKNVEIDARVSDLRREVASLQNHGVGATSYELLRMRHEYEQSVLAAKKAADDADAMGKSVAMFDKTLAEYDAQLARIERAPYVQAADKSVSTAFVPYDDVAAVEVGEKVYGCAVSFLFCHQVGTVAEVLDGEVIGKHPLHNRDMRGILVRLQLDDPKAIEKPVLHLRRKPLAI